MRVANEPALALARDYYDAACAAEANLLAETHGADYGVVLAARFYLATGQPEERDELVASIAEAGAIRAALDCAAEERGWAWAVYRAALEASFTNGDGGNHAA